MMDIEYIIVQAGGRGKRMERLTVNKPKALVPINSLPMIFYNFRKFKDKKFIIIGDYKCDVLKKYLETFADVQYIVVDAKGKKGTCGGVQEAISLIPKDKAFLLIWSDLVLPSDFVLPEKDANYVGISKDFDCRWSYIDGEFCEVKSREHGVAGFFIFQNKEELKDVPEQGEFVPWLKSQNKELQEIALYETREFGLISEYNKLPVSKCRPFNKLSIQGDKLVKEGIDEHGKLLEEREKNWYKYVIQKGFKNIPQIYSYTPFIMEITDGKNVFEYTFDHDTKRAVLEKIIIMLKELHSLQVQPVDYFSVWNNYFGKTFDRLKKIQNLVPFAMDETVRINGKTCRNIFFYKNVVENFLSEYRIPEFCLIHGDCTFSNILLDSKQNPVLIDPRGYFGFSKIVGDANYDWAKLYYSVVGDYDQFNLKRFSLEITDTEVNLTIETSAWKDMEEEFFELLGDSVSKKHIKMIHALIWLSLTTYAWEDYDSICGAFYNGLLYFEDVLEEIL